jgi:hypothetical protein
VNPPPINDPEARELVEKIENYEGTVPEGLTDLFANVPLVIRWLDSPDAAGTWFKFYMSRFQGYEYVQ